MGSHACPVLAKRGHYQAAQAELGDTRRSWVVFLLVRKVLLKRMVGVLTLTTCLQDAVHLSSSAWREGTEESRSVVTIPQGQSCGADDCPSSSFPTPVLRVFSGPTIAPTKPRCVWMLAGASLEAISVQGVRLIFLG